MNKRAVTIILAILIGLAGVYAQQAYAADCAGRTACMPMDDASHSAGAGHHRCSCALNLPPLADSNCRWETPIQPLQKRISYADLDRVKLPGTVPSPFHQDRMPIFNRQGAAHRLDKTDSPFSSPIYLQTLALLC